MPGPAFVFLRQLGHHALGGQHEGRDTGRVKQRRAGHLGRIDYAGFDQVFELSRSRH